MISVLLSSSPWLLFPVSSSLSESWEKRGPRDPGDVLLEAQGCAALPVAGRAEHGVGLLLFKLSLNGSVLEQAEPGTSS